jgi:hypothetical protein
MELRQKVYLSKYALSLGIVECEVTYKSGGRDYVQLKKISDGQGFHDYYKIGRDVFDSRELAVEAANKIKDKKIASLHKQLANLEKIKF